jgi:hypothetical protein
MFGIGLAMQESNQTKSNSNERMIDVVMVVSKIKMQKNTVPTIMIQRSAIGGIYR